MAPPSSPPTGPPDLASPGFWAYVLQNKTSKPGWIQTALNTGPEHKPEAPTKGLPGQWVAVYSTGAADSTHAWLPTELEVTPAAK
jgi:hypothetical protein